MHSRLKAIVRRIESKSQDDSDRELCSHAPPIICWADGRTDNESPHNCGRPRLVISVGYSDGSDKRCQRAVVDCFDELVRKFPDIPRKGIFTIVREAFRCLTSETYAELLEKVKAAEPSDKPTT